MVEGRGETIDAEARKTRPERGRVIRKGKGSHRSGEWSGSVSAEAIGTEMFVLFAAFDEIGEGPVLHVHPYPEVLIVTEGRARVTIGPDVFEVSEGDVATVPANQPHKFENLGPGRLRSIDFHLNRTWIQTDLVDPDA